MSSHFGFTILICFVFLVSPVFVMFFCVLLFYMSDLVEDDAVKESKQLELEGVKAAEAGDVDLALDLFSRAIGVSPQWASGYNNRAQALRLKGDEIGENI